MKAILGLSLLGCTIEAQGIRHLSDTKVNAFPIEEELLEVHKKGECWGKTEIGLYRNFQKCVEEDDRLTFEIDDHYHFTAFHYGDEHGFLICDKASCHKYCESPRVSIGGNSKLSCIYNKQLKKHKWAGKELDLGSCGFCERPDDAALTIKCSDKFKKEMCSVKCKNGVFSATGNKKEMLTCDYENKGSIESVVWWGRDKSKQKFKMQDFSCE
jgi:hypothetical protein